MTRTEQGTSATEETVYKEYLLGVRILEADAGTERTYRFEAPDHEGAHFEAADAAELYADVYFDTNGFEEAGTGERGIPPEVIQAGRDTLAAYFLTQPGTDISWVASFYGKTPSEIERYVASVRARAQEIRDGARERGLE